jgi:DNA/RNA-binding domain of Phe-tRNA-synthetase-like protein
MIFLVEDRLFDFFPSLQIGILVAKVDNTRYGDDVLEPVLTRIRHGLSDRSFYSDPRISEWTTAFNKLGMTRKPLMTSVEFLIGRALKGGIFPRVNPVVDLLSAVSLEFLVPIGSHDISAIEGNIALGFSRGDERFTPIEGGEDEIVEKGEVVYKDDRSVLTRGWVSRQSNKDRVSSDTTLVLMPVDILDHEVWPPVGQILDHLGVYLNGIQGAEISYRNVVDRKSPAAEFTI